jgi:hypothetical protein
VHTPKASLFAPIWSLKEMYRHFFQTDYLHEEKSANAVSLSWQIGAYAEGVFICTNLSLKEMYQHFFQTIPPEIY